MSRRLTLLIAASCLTLVPAIGYLALKPLAKVRVVVSDDNGPVAGVPVLAVGFRRWENGRGVTDGRGEAEFIFRSFSGIFEVDAVMEGYYMPVSPRTTIQFHRRGRFSWEPWPTNAAVLIRKIGNPVTMYAKDACARMDVFAQRRGFDLVIGDWVAPFGAGQTNDFVFELRREVVGGGRTNEMLHLTFTNPGDGIQSYYVPGVGKPKLPMPALAPMEGYRGSWRTGDGLKAGEVGSERGSDPDAELNYYFRVRTRSGADGRVTAGYYGKIYNGILFETDPNLNQRRPCSPGIYFTYYLNPDGTRNTEYSGQNFLQGEGTQVRSP